MSEGAAAAAPAPALGDRDGSPELSDCSPASGDDLEAAELEAAWAHMGAKVFIAQSQEALTQAREAFAAAKAAWDRDGSPARGDLEAAELEEMAAHQVLATVRQYLAEAQEEVDREARARLYLAEAQPEDRAAAAVAITSRPPRRSAASR